MRPEQRGFLAPNDLVTLALQKIPVTPGILHHVICGDRGKGGHKDKTKPVMSDGVVPYWSSRMATAQSELIVRSGHDTHQSPEAIAEVERILKLHAIAGPLRIKAPVGRVREGGCETVRRK